MFDIYLAPTKAFTRLRDKPNWVVPLVIALVATLAVTALSTQYFDWGEQRERAVEQMESRGMSQEQIDAALERMEQFTGNPLARTGGALISTLIFQLVGVFFIALIYNLALPLLGASGNYLRTLSVVCWAGLVAVPSAIVRALLVLLRKSAQVSSSLLLAFPNVKGGFLAVILGRIDVFAIWQLILVGLGLKVVYDLKGSRSYWLAVAVWALATLVFAALAAIGGGR